MNKLFFPAIVLMSRLDYTRKFILLGLTYLIALSIVVYSLYSCLNQVLAASKRQLDGIELIAPISATIHFMQQHRGLSAGVLSGHTDMLNPRKAKQTEAVTALHTTGQRLPDHLVQGEDWMLIKSAWQQLQINGMQWTAEKNFTTHTDLIAQLLKFEQRIADDYALTLAPDIDAFYLLDTTINKLPLLLEQLGQIRALGTSILSNRQLPEQQKSALTALIAELRHTVGFISTNLDKTGRFNPAIQSPLLKASSQISTSAQQIADLVQADIIGGHFIPAPDDFFYLSTAAIDTCYLQLHQTLLPTAKTLIVGRIQHAQNELLLSIGIALLLLLTVHYLLAGIYYAMTASIQSLARSTRAFTTGDIWGHVNLETLTKLDQADKTEETIHELIFYDSLTNLPNRRLLLERLKHSIEVERRDGKQLALMMLDIDRFKIINESLGYLAGDELLQQIATRIATRLRKVDLVARMRKVDLLARFGGDEFIMLLEDITLAEDAARVAEQIIAILSKPFYLSQGDEICITASIGISLYPQHGDMPETLINYADAALNKAKAEGRGCFAYYSEDLTLAARSRIALETRLRKAIEQQELQVFYQPQVDITTGRITGAEALVRWQDPLEGLIAPVHFIPLAEETGLIMDIGAWVLQETCRQGRQWLDAGLPPLMLAVNVSAHQFRRSDVGNLVTTVLGKTGFPAEYLELEMTESGMMENQDKVMELVNNLRALGVRFAIDDFGTGYSSLAYLKHFPLDLLKIDKSFIDDIPHQQDDMEIAATIIAMGHMLGFKVLAEGVETAEQLSFLQDKGCDAYQGYFKSKPLPANEFVALLQAQAELQIL
ncbi:MAG: EAL domain-containing protein [Methylobacter sp.]|nr:EAL domain-containing protein [Methylobacter sp.]MDP2428333.1 EAL domain-containing protein [Methylobacter sp.]MDP3054043.1 EAL domain-containing protein [Methylobacter sp.]MDP3362563.1 EAL domain-containing protein [Methylobacter sp.]MDZ4218397.1 EAL domain-containing protein [Methylobacter sp.]